jgi:hypothetical protein
MKRRWFRFSLRTLLIGVTLFCVVIGGYVGWQAKIIRERNAMIRRIERMQGSVEFGRLDQGWAEAGLDPNLFKEIQPRAVPWVRRLLGDSDVIYIELPAETPASERASIRAVFPESQIGWVSYSVFHDYWNPFLDDDETIARLRRLFPGTKVQQINAKGEIILIDI